MKRGQSKLDSSTLLSVKDLSVVFDLDENKQKKILDDVDLHLKKGSILGIVGESGSGKTQTIYAILGLHINNPGLVNGSIKLNLPNRQKFIELNGSVKDYIQFYNQKYYKKRKWIKKIDEIYDKHNIRGQKIFIMFQEPKSYLNPYWTIAQHFENILPDKIKQENNVNKLIIETLEKFNLPANKILDQYPHEMSGGMNQRIMVALGYACEPDIIVADEITTGLDIVNQVAVVNQLKKIQGEKNQSIIVISHDIGFISKLADDILVMYSGQGVEFGPREKVLNVNEDYKHPYTKDLLEIFHGKKKYIQGDPPKRDEIIQGCRYHTRCEVYQNNKENLNCDKKAPQDFSELNANSHEIRCNQFEIKNIDRKL